VSSPLPPGRHRTARIVAAWTAVVLATSPMAAGAQQAGIPVDYSPAHLPVVGGSILFAQGGGFAGSGTLRSLGARLHYATGIVQLKAGGAAVSTDVDRLDGGMGLHAAVALSLIAPRPARAVNAQIGVGWVRLDSDVGSDLTTFDVPFGVGVGIYAPTPAGPAELWVAPRVHLRHVDFGAGADSATRIGPGASAGLRFTLAQPQAGFDLVLDGMTLRDPFQDGWSFIGSVNLGLHLLLLR
jgi:hypothetical protein